MSMLSKMIARLSLSVQPLIFETGVAEFPYSAVGTVFMVGYKGNPYVITTRHCLGPANPPAICVFPSDVSNRVLPLGRVFFVNCKDEPEDYMDLAVIDVHSSAVNDPDLGVATLIDLALAYETDWANDTENRAFFTIGYPAEKSNVDYTNQEIRTDRITLLGAYGGPSLLPYLHILTINEHEGLASFNGFSGAPVFSARSTSDQALKPIFCGMAIRGTKESGIFHFLDASVLLDALKIKHLRDMKYKT